MYPYLSDVSVPALQVNVAAMAGIVRELVACEQNGQRDFAWLQQRTTAAHLREHEVAALEALCRQLFERHTTLADDVILEYWR